jgi:predicted porin
MLSRFVLSYSNKDKVGLRKTAENNAIDLNTSRFTESIAGLFAEAQPLASLNIALGIDKGKKIDYSNDRLGNYQEIYGYVTWFITNHLKVDLYQSYSEMKADNELTGLHNANVYTENLIDLRFAYQFDVRSYLKLNIVYDDISKNIANNPLSSVSATDKSLSTQLIYSYQINPQTVFYLGYSDSSYQDDDLTQLTRERKTFFSKISYAWQP